MDRWMGGRKGRKRQGGGDGEQHGDLPSSSCQISSYALVDSTHQ